MAGVGVLSAAELFKAELDPRAIAGVGCAVLAVIGAGVGNLFAWRGQKAGAPVLQATAWAMAYGTGLLFLYGLFTGVHWSFDTSPSYVLSLLHLAVFGSVVAFLIYFSLARSSGYALASYVSALTPPVAMLMSVAFEHARFGLGALGGLVLVLGGQVLLIKGKEA
jgi:drug/metabolite transporter (DMT)-like permease